MAVRFTVQFSPTSKRWLVVDGLSKRAVNHYGSERAARKKCDGLIQLPRYYVAPRLGDTWKVYDRDTMSCVAQFPHKAKAERHADELNEVNQ